MPPKKGKAAAAGAAAKPILGRPTNNVSMGIVGLPNIGKSTFFNLMCNMSVAAENYPFCTIDPTDARVPVPVSAGQPERWSPFFFLGCIRLFAVPRLLVSASHLAPRGMAPRLPLFASKPLVAVAWPGELSGWAGGCAQNLGRACALAARAPRELASAAPPCARAAG